MEIREGWREKLRRRVRGPLRRLIRVVRRMKISTRLVSLFVLSSFLPLLLIGTWIYRRASDTLYNNTNKVIVSMSRQTASYISEKMLKVISDSVEISNSENVQNILRWYEDYDTIKLYQTTKEIIREMSKKYVFNDIVTEITIYTLSGQRVNLYGPYSYRFKPTEEELESMKAENEASPKNILFSANANNSIILFRQVKDKETREQIGYLVMRVDENCISDIYPDALSDVDIESFVVNSKGIIVSAKNDEMLSGSYPDEALAREIIQENLEGRGEFSVNLADGKKIVNHSAVTGTDWHFISVVSDSFFRVDSRQFQVRLFLSVALCLLIATVISLTVAFSIVIPTRSIISAMKRYGEDSSDCRIEDDGKDELAFMSDNFNQMSLRLNQQMQDIRDGEKQKRRLEIQALQAQINPHFIANTLNLISYIASVNNEPGIERLSDSLVDLMRDCLRNDERLVTVADEISRLQSYINIQNYRLLGKFSIQMEIEPGLDVYLMPHMVLQPIVENALLHGILPDKKKRGLISIQGCVEGKDLVFTVTDNGKGMEQEQICRVFSGEDANREKGRINSIGLSNVQQRIRLLFGPEYGLSINSLREVYTAVSIRLPVITEQEG